MCLVAGAWPGVDVVDGFWLDTTWQKSESASSSSSSSSSEASVVLSEEEEDSDMASDDDEEEGSLSVSRSIGSLPKAPAGRGRGAAAGVLTRLSRILYRDTGNESCFR